MRWISELRARWRLYWGLCPACNSDAPELYTCDVCKGSPSTAPVVAQGDSLAVQAELSDSKSHPMGYDSHLHGLITDNVASALLCCGIDYLPAGVLDTIAGEIVRGYTGRASAPVDAQREGGDAVWALLANLRQRAGQAELDAAEADSVGMCAATVRATDEHARRIGAFADELEAALQAQQGAVVDEAMVERATAAYDGYWDVQNEPCCTDSTCEVCGGSGAACAGGDPADAIRAALTAALAHATRVDGAGAAP